MMDPVVLAYLFSIALASVVFITTRVIAVYRLEKAQEAIAKHARCKERGDYCHCVSCRRERSERVEAGKPPPPPALITNDGKNRYAWYDAWCPNCDELTRCRWTDDGKLLYCKICATYYETGDLPEEPIVDDAELCDAVAALAAGAPDPLDTLDEIAAALGVPQPLPSRELPAAANTAALKTDALPPKRQVGGWVDDDPRYRWDQKTQRYIDRTDAIVDWGGNVVGFITERNLSVRQAELMMLRMLAGIPPPMIGKKPPPDRSGIEFGERRAG